MITIRSNTAAGFGAEDEILAGETSHLGPVVLGFVDRLTNLLLLGVKALSP